MALVLFPLHHLPPLLLLLFQLFLWCFLPSCVKATFNYLLSELQSMKSENLFSDFLLSMGTDQGLTSELSKVLPYTRFRSPKQELERSTPFAAELKRSSVLYFVNKEQHRVKAVPLHPTLPRGLAQIYQYTTTRTKEH